MLFWLCRPAMVGSGAQINLIFAETHTHTNTGTDPFGALFYYEIKYP